MLSSWSSSYLFVGVIRKRAGVIDILLFDCETFLPDKNL